MSRNKSKNLCADIISAAKKRGIDPATTPFRPSDLGIIASDYGAFADWCDEKQTKSGKWNRHVCLTVAEWRTGRPFKYVLLSQHQWV